MKKNDFKALSFLNAVSKTKKDMLPIFSKLYHYGDRIQGSNGVMVMDAPFDLKGDFLLDAVMLCRAVDNCSDDITITPTKNKIKIESSTFNVSLFKHTDTYPKQEFTGTPIKIKHGIIDAFRCVFPFVNPNAPRAWARGCLIKDKKIFATNNVAVVSLPIDIDSSVNINVPGYLIRELISQKDKPTKMYLTNNTIGFKYEDTRWIRGQRFSADWPEITKIIPEMDTVKKYPPGFFEAVKKISKFSDSYTPIIYLSEKGIATHTSGHSAEDTGFTFPESAFQADQLCLVLEHATHIDLSKYPNPCPFLNTNNNLNGVVMGMSNV